MKQHYVAQCYLKAWCDPDCPPDRDPYVWRFDRDGSNPRNKAPRNIFHETDMYTIVEPDGTHDLRIEQTLSHIEGQFCGVRDKLHREEPLDLEERIYLCAFTAATHTRTPKMRAHQSRQWGHVFEVMSDQEAMQSAPPEQVASMGRIERMTSSSGPSMTMEQVKQLATQPLQSLIGSALRSEVPDLLKMVMSVFVTDDPTGFLTTDAPCVWFDATAQQLPPIHRSVGLGNLHIEVTLPVSPSHMVMFSRCPALAGYKTASPQLVQEANRRHLAHCNEEFVVRKNSLEPYWFLDSPPDQKPS